MKMDGLALGLNSMIITVTLLENKPISYSSESPKDKAVLFYRISL